MPEDAKQKRGRPALTPQQKAQSELKRREYLRAYRKERGRAAQNKWDQSEKGKLSNKEHIKRYRATRYRPAICIPASKKDALVALSKSEGMSINQLFVMLIKEKYGIDLS